MAELEQIRAEMHHLKNAELAENYKKYLKSPYSFYGIRVPEMRKIAKKYKFNKMCMAAHSIGGLTTRALLTNYKQNKQNNLAGLV